MTTGAVERNVRTDLPHGISYEEYLQWLDDETHAEWVNGEVELMSPVSYEHARLKGFVQWLLQTFLALRGGGVVLDEPFQMKTGPDLPGRSPDILLLAEEHRERLKRTYLNGPADLVVEIVSTDSRGRDRGDKFYEYEEGGVHEYWILDPERRQAEFYVRNEQGHYGPVAPDPEGVYRSSVLQGFWLRVDWLWADSKPQLLEVLRAWGAI